MADDTTTKAAPKVTADTAAAIAEALRQTKMNPLGVAAEGPTARVRAAAAAIARGTGVVRVMADAGYGRRYIDGHAAGFPAFLRAHGLLTDAQARKAIGEVLAGGGA